MPPKSPHILVVGTGIVGSSLAYQLARQQARVTLISNASGPADSATETSFAWINGGYEASESYRLFRQQAMADWHRLSYEFNGRLSIDWSGALTWYADTAKTEHTAHRLAKTGYPVRLVDRQEIRRLEPNLSRVPEQAMFAETDGAIDPVLTTAMLLAAAREAGATIRLGNEVLSLMTDGSRVTGVVTTAGKLTADVVVLAAGINTAALCQPLGINLPVHKLPAILLTYQNNKPFVNRILSNEFMEIRAVSPTLTVVADEYIDESIENSPLAIAQRTAERIKEHWLGTEQIKVASIRVGHRPIPQDGLPIIGPVSAVGGLYISVMHAGVTLASLVGRLVTSELLSRSVDTALALYRPARFDSGQLAVRHQ